METAVRDREIREKHAVPCQNLFCKITSKAESCGMKVNSSKTAMMCINVATIYCASAHISTNEGERVQSGDSLKVLGFNLLSKSDVHAHVDSLKKRFRKKY